MTTMTNSDNKRLLRRYESVRDREAEAQHRLRDLQREERRAEIEREVAGSILSSSELAVRVEEIGGREMQLPSTSSSFTGMANKSHSSCSGQDSAAAGKEVDLLAEKEEEIKRLEDKLREAGKREKDLIAELKIMEQRLLDAIISGSDQDCENERRKKIQLESHLQEIIGERTELREQLTRAEDEAFQVKRRNKMLERQVDDAKDNDKVGAEEQNLLRPKVTTKGNKTKGAQVWKHERNKSSGKHGSDCVVVMRKVGREKSKSTTEYLELGEAPFCLKF